MVGDEHGALLKQISEARDRVKAARELDKLFVSGGESPASKISRGLRTRQAAGQTRATA
jgi:hypothetical protein